MSGAQMMMQGRQPAAGGGGTTYVEHNMLGITSGTLATVPPPTDATAAGWQGAANFVFQGDGSGVQETSGVAGAGAWLGPVGQEDLKYTMEWVAHSAFGSDRHDGVNFRGSNTQYNNALQMVLAGASPWSDLDVTLRDGYSGAPINTWDISALTGTTIGIGQTIRMVFSAVGNVVTLISITKNGTLYTINDAFTLTGTPLAGHGAGTNLSYCGIFSNERVASSQQRFHYFKVESP